MKAKFIKLDVSSIFDKCRVYGDFIKADEFGNYHILPRYRFSWRRINMPRQSKLGRLWGDKKLGYMWGNTDDEGWRFELGKLLVLPKQGIDVIEEVDESEARVLQSAYEAVLERGGSFSFL